MDVYFAATRKDDAKATISAASCFERLHIGCVASLRTGIVERRGGVVSVDWR